MRTLFSVLALLLVMSAFSQSKYETAIFRGKQMIAAADTLADYQQAVNYFERIGKKEQDQWLPRYYQAQVLAFMASDESDLETKEVTLNTALAHIEAAKRMERNAELLALEGFVQMLRLTVDPSTRGQTLSPVIFGLYQQALGLDAENPRALLFMGQMQYGTAQFFGTGFEDACTTILKAYHIFEKQPEAPTIFPDWGMASAKASMENCNQ